MAGPPENTRRRIGVVALKSLVLVALVPAWNGACRRTDESGLLKQAETLCLDAQWQEAKVILKQYLVRRPNDAAGHFYLGRCYLFSEDFRPTLAEGEIQTALSLFLENGKKSPIERFTDDYFEMICYVESAKVSLIEINRFRAYGLKIAHLGPLVDKCKRYAQLARDLMPGAEEVKELDHIIGRIEGGRLSGRDTSSHDVQTMRLSRLPGRATAARR